MPAISCQYPGCTYQANNSDELYNMDGKLICERHLTNCDSCDKYLPKDHLKEMPSGNDICIDCQNAYYTTCPNHRDLVSKEELLLPTSRNRYNLRRGGCSECAFACDSCGKITDNDNKHTVDRSDYCDDCYTEHFAHCDECGEEFNREETQYDEYSGHEYCNDCYDEKFANCEKCHNTHEKSDMHENMDGEYFCDDCYKGAAQDYYSKYLDKENEISYSPKIQYLNQLYKFLPIDIKSLRKNHQDLFAKLSDLIKFAGGKTLTKEIVQAYQQTLPSQIFPIEFSTWDSRLQRSVGISETPQLVINIKISPQMDNILKTNPAMNHLFNSINTISKQSTHPFVVGQLGWARLELHPEDHYLLVDEIQCDHQNAAYKLMHGTEEELRKIRRKLMSDYALDETQFNDMLKQYILLTKDFPNIAMQVITQFARQNNIPKIYYHTYEGGKKLKQNDPPKSLYTHVPKEHLFKPTEEKPFDLDADFLTREASQVKYLIKFAKYLFYKYSS